MLQGVKNKKIWGSIKSLEALQPNANARSNYSGNILPQISLLFLLGRRGRNGNMHFRLAI